MVKLMLSSFSTHLDPGVLAEDAQVLLEAQGAEPGLDTQLTARHLVQKPPAEKRREKDKFLLPRFTSGSYTREKKGRFFYSCVFLSGVSG